MSENTKTPRIRFKGFTDAWEQRKFKELYDRVSEKNDLSYGVEQIISVANMYYKADSSISDKEYLRTYNVFELGDIAFEGNKSKDFKHGRFVENTIGNGIVSHVFDVFRPIMLRYDLLYWKYAINNERIMGQVLMRCTKASTMMTNLVARDFLEEHILVPEYEEQKRIGIVITKLDNLITLHQRKCDKLKNIKAALLEKMFPQGDATTPKIRFKGFTDAWEQRKAGTLFISFVEKGFPDLPVLSATQDKGMVYRDDSGKMVFHDKNNESGYKRVQPGQFVIHLRSFQGGFAHSNILGITSPAYTIFGFKEGESQYDLFWKSIFSSSDFIRRLESVTYGIRDGRSISYDEFLTMKFFIPKYNEQVKIATCLMKIDDLITLHQRKVEKLKNIKSALLEKMFV